MMCRVTSIICSSVGRLVSAIGDIHSCEPIAIAEVSRSTSEGTRSSRACTSATLNPIRIATASTTALSRSDQPSAFATMAATSEPPDP